MAEKIVTKIFNYGDDCESSWPPTFGTRDTSPCHIDKDGKFQKGRPQRANAEINAPYIIGDTIERYYHPAAERFVDSRSKLRDMDQACGTITTDKKQPPDPSEANYRKAALKKDQHEALHKAVAQIDAGNAPLSEETRAMCDRQNELISSALNFDAFNVVGRKNNAKGKRFRRRY